MIIRSPFQLQPFCNPRSVSEGCYLPLERQASPKPSGRFTLILGINCLNWVKSAVCSMNHLLEEITSLCIFSLFAICWYWNISWRDSALFWGLKCLSSGFVRALILVEHHLISPHRRYVVTLSFVREPQSSCVFFQQGHLGSTSTRFPWMISVSFLFIYQLNLK